ncbi:alpha/beta fold hydrolase [Phycicoccus sonneratiae]|uniref:Alpha/beta fold hydrolase n=1 Tax=Phycicoccus sonneratiae TaxID=2807628 RepID=A0ABS2CI38_9MICO|nr:alpha/beta fold hydrolase [Phycicoccus sonneraticus]MBM6398846.1 alpha/beta fold hydrolase [Phycicoccus sonneraticus]
MTHRPTTDPTTAPDRVGHVPTRLGRLHVRSGGDGDGAPVVLWSSMFVDGHTWDRFLPHLRTDRRYLVVDPPGLGRSEPLRRRSTVAEAADAATDLLAAVYPDAPVDWVGNALGGHVGLDLGTRPGVLRSLVAVSSPTEAIAPALRRQIHLLLPLLRTLGPVGPVRDAVLEAMLTDASRADEEVRRVVADSLSRPTRRSAALAVRSFILDRVDVTARLADLTVPSLFVASDDRGDWDPRDAEAAARLAPRAEAVTVAGARTLVPLEQPEALARHVERFHASLED